MSPSILTQTRSVLHRFPFLFFFGAIILLFVIIVLAHSFRQPVEQKTTIVPEPKAVAAFVVGTDTTSTEASALVRKDTVQPIVALIAGTVQEISVRPGSRVSAATPLLRLSADYGANRAGIENALATENQRFTEEMNRLDRKILSLEKKAARHDETLDDTREALALKRLKRERAALQESLVTGALTVDLSQAEEAVFQPRSFVPATVEHIAVHVGDFVTPGTVLAVLRTETGSTTLEAALDPALAHSFDPTTPSKLRLPHETPIELLPSFFSQGETPDGLFVVRYLLSPESAGRVTDGARVSLSVPLRAPTGKTLVPLDALFTHTDHTSLFIASNGQAEERTVEVENVFGSAALLKGTLSPGTTLLLDRTLIAGELVTPNR